ncbi:PAS domain S-box protein [Hydrogenimonas sp. SS33]|uniref:PAS domain-containing sensor histidine kinase n=1 Tax=Hydrogenimonas leucolamina TaxID=2954236 RepID=UPI00336BEFAC
MRTIDYREIVENCRDILWQTDKKGVVTYVNSAVQRVLGYKPSEMAGKSITSFLPATEKRLFRKLYHLMKKREEESFEGLVHSLIHKEGHTLLFEAGGYAFRDETGNLIGYRGICRKISGTKPEIEKSERELFGDRIILESVINTLPIRIFWKDRNFRYLGANRLFLQDLGFGTLQEIAGKDDYTLMKAETAEICRRGDLQILHTGRDMHGLEESFYSHSGEKMWISLYKTPLQDRYGNIFGILGAYIDITKIKQQELALKENTYRLKEAQRIAKIGYWDYNHRKRKILLSEETWQLIGQTPSDPEVDIGILFQMFPEEEWKRVRKSFLKTVTERAQQFEIFVKGNRRKGEETVFRLYAHIVYDYRRKPIGAKGVIQDVSESYRLHRENEVKQRLLMHQTRLAQMGQLLNNIAHQWKQPLAEINALLLNMDTDFRYGELDRQRFAHYYEQLEKTTAFMGETIETFQAYTIPHRETGPIAPSKALEKALSLLQSRIEKTGVSVNIRKRTQIRTIGTYQETVQVFLVLLNNALDAFETRSTRNPKIDIDIRERREGTENRCLITLCDNAGGISPDIAEEIFDPYFTTKFRDKGHGIGLYIAKMIVENLMQGSLSLADERKSLFRIELKGVS